MYVCILSYTGDSFGAWVGWSDKDIPLTSTMLSTFVFCVLCAFVDDVCIVFHMYWAVIFIILFLSSVLYYFISSFCLLLSSCDTLLIQPPRLYVCLFLFVSLVGCCLHGCRCSLLVSWQRLLFCVFFSFMAVDAHGLVTKARLFVLFVCLVISWLSMPALGLVTKACLFAESESDLHKTR